MTLRNKRGILNAAESVIYTLSAELPALIAAANAENSVVLRSYLAGSYTFPSGTSTLIAGIGTDTLSTIAMPTDSTYTAAQLVTYFENGDEPSLLPDGMGSRTVKDGTTWELYGTTQGAANYIKLGDGTTNSLFGWVNGRVENYLPLKNIAWYGMVPESLDALIPDYPAILVEVPQVVSQAEGGGIHLVSYTVNIRIYDSNFQPSWQTDALFRLAHMAELIQGIFRDMNNSSLDRQVVTIRPPIIRPGREIEVIGGALRAWIDITTDVTSQEVT